MKDAAQNQSVFDKLHLALAVVNTNVQAMTFAIFLQLGEKRVVGFDANPSPAKRLLEQQRIAEADAVGRAEVEKVAAAAPAQRFENEEILTILRGRNPSFVLSTERRRAPGGRTR